MAGKERGQKKVAKIRKTIKEGEKKRKEKMVKMDSKNKSRSY